ncbi:MAG TPA: TonB-dependent receptor, partial [Caulobacteraceae bacterium]|nr:TonB-dependent receptor [Caulobacteraceae bacterium]
MARRSKAARARLLCGSALASVTLWASAASAQEAEINIPPQSLATALYTFAGQTGHQVMFSPDLTGAKKTPGVSGVANRELALSQLLVGSGLTYQRQDDTFLIVRADSPQSGSAAGEGAEVEALIVTAQKREENIQDVPIAISAFSQKALEEQKIEGGFDLLKAIPNVTFSKSNFTSYNFSIRGVGTKAVSATTDPGVSVSFNNTGLIQNRLFEQEYFDVERVEVLRGPQGTLYGRNATSGVINVISAKPDLNDFEGTVKLEAGNFNAKRASAMINIPIIEDMLAVRVAGAMTQRDGYDFNTETGNAVNGRDLWSGRVTVGFEPTERMRGNFIWERFSEDDNRSRTGKQLCHRDDGPTHIGDQSLLRRGDYVGESIVMGQVEAKQALFSQGCKAGSLYDAGAFGTPNGLTLPFVLAPIYLRAVATAIGQAPVGQGPGGFDGLVNRRVAIFQPFDPYAGRMQSTNLREIASVRDPIYRASADIIELNLEFDVTPSLTFVSQTAYNEDDTYSFQDFNRFSSIPMFTDTTDLISVYTNPQAGTPSEWRPLAPRPAGSPVGTAGVFCDPQIGCTDKIAGFDISTAVGTQFSQEFRLQSSFDGPMNFSVGANYTKFQTLVDYYVMFNALTAIAYTQPFFTQFDMPGLVFTPGLCSTRAFNAPRPAGAPQHIPSDYSGCVYVDPNPLESMNGEGHNYFRSKNPYKLKSWAAFGEGYWNVTEALKLTAGLRYTDDTKTFIPVPTQLLLAPQNFTGGMVSKGHPEDPPIEQNWGEFSGRLGVDWKVETPFTDETLLYAFYSRGYKAGGANPPQPGFAERGEYVEAARAAGYALVDLLDSIGYYPQMFLTAVEYGPTFDPEFVNAFEVGSKNTLLSGALTFNATGFYYDYTDYQISQIRDRTAVNENFDA